MARNDDVSQRARDFPRRRIVPQLLCPAFIGGTIGMRILKLEVALDRLRSRYNTAHIDVIPRDIRVRHQVLSTVAVDSGVVATPLPVLFRVIPPERLE